MPVNAPAGATLVIHRGALGDVLGAVPALHALRAAFPEERIVLMAQPERADLLARCGIVDETINVERADLASLFSAAPRETAAAEGYGRFARAVAWVHDPGGVLKRNLQACGVRSVLVAPPFSRVATTAHSAHLLSTLSGLDIRAEAPDWRVQAHPEDVAEAGRWLDERLPDRDRPLVVVHPGSGSAKKNWPREAFARVATALRAAGDAHVVVVCGPAEAEAGLTAFPWTDCADGVAADLPLRLVAGLAARCDVWVGNDAGTTHLAAALARPTVAVFGAASDMRVWAPRGRHVQVIAGTCGAGAVARDEEILRVAGRIRARLGVTLRGAPRAAYTGPQRTYGTAA